MDGGGGKVGRKKSRSVGRENKVLQGQDNLGITLILRQAFELFQPMARGWLVLLAGVSNPRWAMPPPVPSIKGLIFRSIHPCLFLQIGPKRERTLQCLLFFTFLK
jgi:hypothetical protein